jgi:ABC-type amino acid transport substrate-binding protein
MNPLRRRLLRAAATVPAVIWQRTLAAGNTAAAPAAMRYLHPPPESPLDHRYDFEWAILRAALERTRANAGPYVIGASEFMTERRQVYELARGIGALTLLFLGTTPEMERELLPVRIPVDRNLQGYCVFLIRDGEQERFRGVRTVADLKAFSFGLGLGWIDVEVLRANGLGVVTGSSYEGLFEMLVRRRFDVFLRSSVEVLDEYAQRQARFPALAIEPRLLLYYPMPMYFWFSRTPQGERLAARVEAGMRMLLDDGSYDRLFAEYQDLKITRLQLARRRLLRIDNPLLGPETPFADRRLWFDPATYRGPG